MSNLAWSFMLVQRSGNVEYSYLYIQIRAWQIPSKYRCYDSFPQSRFLKSNESNFTHTMSAWVVQICMRLLTWNINGLRAVLKRKYGTVKALLEDLGADIICFQETKLTKADFERELALVDGWWDMWVQWHMLEVDCAQACKSCSKNSFSSEFTRQ